MLMVVIYLSLEELFKENIIMVYLKILLSLLPQGLDNMNK